MLLTRNSSLDIGEQIGSRGSSLVVAPGYSVSSATLWFISYLPNPLGSGGTLRFFSSKGTSTSTVSDAI